MIGGFMAVEDKWRWKMDYCKKQGIPPAQTWAWEQAEKAFCMTYNTGINARA